MNQTFDLKNMGFAEMSEHELQVIDGGGFWAAVAAAVVCGVVDVATGGATIGVTGVAVYAAYKL